MIAISATTQEIFAGAEEVISSCEDRRSALITVLQRVQEKLGYLQEEAVTEVARLIGLSQREVYGVATFYNYFRLKPCGANQISVCRGTACHVLGGPRVLEAVKRALGIQQGEITTDLKYSLDTMACIGDRVLAPNIVINGQPYGKMTAKKAADLVGNPPSEGDISPGMVLPRRSG